SEAVGRVRRSEPAAILDEIADAENAVRADVGDGGLQRTGAAGGQRRKRRIAEQVDRRRQSLLAAHLHIGEAHPAPEKAAVSEARAFRDRTAAAVALRREGIRYACVQYALCEAQAARARIDRDVVDRLAVVGAGRADRH